MRPYSILIIENHPLTYGIYTKLIEQVADSIKFLKPIVEISTNCRDAMKSLLDKGKDDFFDIIILGICIPYSRHNKMMFGEELGIKIRKKYPESRIIISTRIDCNFRIRTMLRHIRPNGFLLKKEITEIEFMIALIKVIQNQSYYSSSIIELLQKEVTTNLILDDIDRRLIYELSIGTRMKTLLKVLPLSRRAIEKRKMQLKELLDIDQDEDDRELVIKCMEEGII